MFKKIIFWCIPIIMSLFVAGCGGSGGDPILGQPVSQGLIPTVVAVAPVNNELNVSYNIKTISAEFSVPMDPATLTRTSFTLFDVNSSTAVTTTIPVSYANRVAELTLDTNLSQNTVYRATITTVAKSAAGVALATNHVWTFTTGTSADAALPTVISTSPRNGDLNVSITKIITATFSEAMKASSITAAGTFTLMETNGSINVPGTTTYSVINKIASFKPTNNLTADMNYTATITTAAKDLADRAIATNKVWTFVTADANASLNPPLVALGLASTYGIASTAGVTNTGATHIEGDAVFNPTATCNGDQIANADGPGFGSCGLIPPTINGTVVTPVYPVPSPAQDVTDDLRAAYLSITPANMPGGTSIAAGTTLGAPTGSAPVVGDNLFTTGVYTSNTSILITGDLTLDAQNNPNATFVFQSATSIGTAPSARILLVNGAKASNVYWQAGSDVTLQTGSSWNGNILAYRSITMVTGASSCGRLFAGAFTDGLFVFDSNKVSVPGKPYALGTCE